MLKSQKEAVKHQLGWLKKNGNIAKKPSYIGMGEDAAKRERKKERERRVKVFSSHFKSKTCIPSFSEREDTQTEREREGLLLIHMYNFFAPPDKSLLYEH